MTGPEHYREAEGLLATAHQPGKRGVCTHAEAIAQAQVHATLALSAATVHAAWVNNQYLAGSEDGDYARWAEAVRS